MPASKKNKTIPKKAPEKEKHYELIFPNPKGVPAFWFDQFSIEQTKTHLVVKVGSSIGDGMFAFALSKSELSNQNFNFGTYIEQLNAAVDENEVEASKVKRILSSQNQSHSIHSVRYIRAGRVGSDGELALYTFSTTTLLHETKAQSADAPKGVEAEPIVVLHADLNVHYGLILELIGFTSEGLK